MINRPNLSTLCLSGIQSLQWKYLNRFTQTLSEDFEKENNECLEFSYLRNIVSVLNGKMRVKIIVYFIFEMKCHQYDLSRKPEELCSYF